MGRRKKELSPTENSEIMYSMQRKFPDWKWALCPVCNQWAVVFSYGENENIYSNMHPMGCYDTPAGARVLAEIKKKKIDELNVSLF